ncbi:dual specificity phosphatase [Indivirus ILV1]|uniref:Dual specificity phosphatase n=1 Tax=Indivirus ILV1 TaxID=1977633 RepID=A0A1V0SCT5_9VIRU|nr:dual specificity phosphatase [Indivirus ILV1]
MCEFPEYDVNEIISGLWLGNIKSAYDRGFLYNYKIKHILTLYEEFDNSKKYNGINYFIIRIRDKDMCNGNTLDMFEQTNQFILQALKRKENILVHCKKGHHRSGAAVAAFLIKHCKYDYENAIQYINKLRPCALRRDKCMSNDLFKYSLLLKGINIKDCNIQCQKYDKGNGMSRYGCYCS